MQEIESCEISIKNNTVPGYPRKIGGITVNNPIWLAPLAGITFGSLRKFINPDHEPGKMLFAVLREEQIGVAKSCIHDVCGSLDRPNAGIMFTVPVTSVEGVE